MVEQAAREHALEVGSSFVVGDRYADVELAHNAGARGVLVRSGYGQGEVAWHAGDWRRPPDFIARDLAEAAVWILGQTR